MANYPTSISTNGNLYIAVNGLQTTLAVACTNSATTLTLTSTTGFPTTGFVTIDNTEIVSYTGVSGATITGCTRGADGTTAASHPVGVTVGLTIVAAHHNLLKDEIIAIETALGVSLANVFPATPTTGTGNVVLQTSPTINSPTLTTPALGTPSSGVMTNVTGLPLTTGVTGTLPVANGGTGTTTSTGTGSTVLSNSPTLVTPALGTPSAVNLANATNLPNSATTATPNATASTIMSRDASVNVKVNEMIENFSTTVTAAGTTTLTVTSSPLQQFTGTTTQTVVLPDATTLAVGFYFTVMNRSTGAVTVNKNGGTLQATVAATAQSTFVCTSTATAAGTWDTSTSSGGSATAYREDYVVGTALNNYTGSSTVFDLVTPYSVGGHSLVVTLDGDVQTIGATIDYQETNSTRVTFNNALVTGQKVSFIFQTATSSGGTVNSGTTGQVAYFPATGPTVSGTSDPTLVPVIGLGALNILNILINGGMELWQRGTSFSSPVDSTYIADRWKVSRSGAWTFTVDRESTLVDTGSQYSMKVNITAAGTALNIAQAIEFWRGYIGVPVTISARVRCSATGLVRLRVADGSSVFTTSFNASSGAYETLTYTLTGGAVSDLNFALDFAASTGTVYIDNVMVSKGTLAPTFIPADPQQDLARCQRYFYTTPGVNNTYLVNGQCRNTTGASYIIQFPVPMRTGPTLTVNNATNFKTWAASGSQVALTALADGGGGSNVLFFLIDSTVASGLVAGNASFLLTANANAQLFFSAEL